MDANSHARYLGRLIANLHSLVVALRVAIAARDTRLAVTRWRFDKLTPGEHVPADAFSLYEGLKATIARYNRLVNAGSRLDPGALVLLRDAVAHGRVLAADIGPAVPFRLVKFGKKARDGTYPVEFAATMTAQWFKEQIKLTYRALITVAKSTPQAFPNGAEFRAE
jgi:hypothetical protein